MGNSFTNASISNYKIYIKTKNGTTYTFSYHALVEHILLLRNVIDHPEMTEDGPELNYYIQDYCSRMANEQMLTKKQQLRIPWQTEWIWHVHRLHPLAYLNDCKTQLSWGVVDNAVKKLVVKQKNKSHSEMKFQSIETGKLFVTTIDLTKAVIQQRDFLDKLKKHHLMSDNLHNLNKISFENLVQNYVSFMKLGRKDELIVPTFDIDIMWHTHMRYPSYYTAFSLDLCGFILNHDDSIETNILTDGYSKTADYWKKTYGSEYGSDIDREKLAKSQYLSSCAMIIVPIKDPTVSLGSSTYSTEKYSSSGVSRGYCHYNERSYGGGGCGGGGSCDSGGGGHCSDGGGYSD